MHNMLHTYNSTDEMMVDLEGASAGGDKDNDAPEPTKATSTHKISHGPSASAVAIEEEVGSREFGRELV